MTGLQTITLSENALNILEWLGEWTVEIHKAVWGIRKRWEPGFREIGDNDGYRGREKAVAELSLCNVPSVRHVVLEELLPHRLVEGVYRCCRLTPRGRAALLLNGRKCPDVFVSHCDTIFDDVSLLPTEGVPNSWGGVKGPDTMETWVKALLNLKESIYGTLSSEHTAPVQMSRLNGITNLNGVLRESDRCIRLEVRSSATSVCEILLSSAQLTDMLTSNMPIPCTLAGFAGKNGMWYEEPATPPISASDRMKARLAMSEAKVDETISEIYSMVQEAKLGKKAKTDILHTLSVLARNSDANRGFVVQQALEEVSEVIEGANSHIASRMNLLTAQDFLHSTAPALMMSSDVALITSDD